MKQVVIATNHDDWKAIFVDGVQKTAGHEIRERELLPLVVGESCEVYEWYVEPEYSYDLGGFPQLLSDIPEDKILEKTKLV